MALSAVQRAYCNNLLELTKKAIAIQKKIDDIRAAIAKIRAFKLGAALKTLADNVGAELSAVAGQLASQIVGAAAGALSGAAAAIFQMIFKQILKILLAGPAAIFSMISLPLGKAKKHTQRERLKLLSAKGRMSVCIRIISKWLSGYGGEKYVQQMKDALPYIQAVLRNTGEMLNQLNTTDKAPYFNSATYGKILSDLKTSVSITEPKSQIITTLDFQTSLDAAQDEEIKNQMNDPGKGIGGLSINDYYDKKKEDYAEEYRKSIKTNNPSSVSAWDIVATAQEYSKKVTTEAENMAAKTKYTLQIESLDSWYELQKQIITNDVKVLRVDIISRSFSQSKDKLAANFSADYNELTKNLKGMRSDIIDAFADYKQSQLYTGITYGALDRLKALMGFFIDAAAYGSNGSAQIAITMLEESRELVLDTFNTFTADIYDAGRGELLAAKASLDVSIANVELKAADAVLKATLVKNLTDTINLEGTLVEESKKFDVFKGELEKIPDFNGDKNKWGVNDPVSLADVGKYFSLIGDIVKLAASAPTLITGSSKLMSQIKKVNKTFDDMLTHNTKVSYALEQYTPLQNEMTNELKRMIDALGSPLFANILMALSVADLLAELGSNFDINGRCDEDPEHRAKVAALENAYEIQAQQTRDNLEASMKNNLAAMEEMLEKTKDFFKKQTELIKAKVIASQELRTSPPQDPGLEPNNSAETRNSQAAYYSSAV